MDLDFGLKAIGKIISKENLIISGRIYKILPKTGSKDRVSLTEYLITTISSALYVVDLVRFRELAAGDRLRAQYQQLSADPNSLANLDQDLPNNMQHIVPIFSLPQEWLWCETWCSDESLKKAKTIDLVCSTVRTP